MPKRPSYPRINCCIAGCKRGSTKFEPGTRIICGKCWRRAPKENRAAVTLWQKRGRQFVARGEEMQADLAFRRAHIHFERIRALLSDEGEPSPGLHPVMAEELRKAGLI